MVLPNGAAAEQELSPGSSVLKFITCYTIETSIHIVNDFRLLHHIRKCHNLSSGGGTGLDIYVHIRKQADLYPFYAPIRSRIIKISGRLQLKRWLFCSRHDEHRMKFSIIGVHGLKI